MSDPTTAVRPVGRWRLPLRAGTVARVGVVVILAILPFYLHTAFEQTGLLVFSALIAAIGLNLLTGTTGQLSLAHAFFVAVGAYGYAYFANEPAGSGEASGLGLPSLLALVLAVILAGLFGLIFSPISSRLRGIYLGIASLALIFIGQHIMYDATSLTGGFNGRTVAPFWLGGFSFTSGNPTLYVLGVPFGQYERLWYLGLVLAVLSYLFAKNLLRGRPGRAMQAVRDGEGTAAILGVNVRRYKAGAFVVSSMYAGLAGVVFALTVNHIVPASFDFTLTVSYLAAIVIGGLGSVGGAAIGAVFVAALPQLLTQYSGAIPFLAAPGSGGVDAGSFASYIYGAAVVLVLVFEPEGLAAATRGFSQKRAAKPRRGTRAAARTETAVDSREVPETSRHANS